MKVLIDKKSGFVQAFNDKDLCVMPPMFLMANRKDQLLYDLQYGPSDYHKSKRKSK